MTPKRRPGDLTERERGYGAPHKKLRRQLAPIVATGGVRCARCGELIAPGAPWDLGHDDHDRSQYIGPEHRSCSRASASADRRLPPSLANYADHAAKFRSPDGRPWSREW